MKELDSDNLQEIIQQNAKVVVQYGAGWCGNCRMIKPKFKRLAEATDGVEFYYVDAEKYPNSRGLGNVQNLPAFAGFVGGELKGTAVGTKIENVEALVNEVTGN